ncbi:MAG: hypothetical protein AVDCRST_MAG21-1208 [uncultured Nocardioidaceae bacterium]|uniref:Sulfotransferase family protein n=1 Tax=uncultured Nocardioidaceae bacterium TaxID=253824 RepID=A0A6J4N274_9ACTN|nr:MAG: hypothetical protein AVDCRST_MAG21-1208 [uncultured Nocardioidaceae bacterium]
MSSEANPGAAAPRRRVFLHVGCPKTGTTFLQNVLWSQRDLAKAQGLLLPLGTFRDHYLASLDVRELAGRKEHPARAAGMWTAAIEESRRWDGDVLISHELFAGATAAQAEKAVAAWGEEDIHVIVTARDLERQIPAEWQEHIKHRATMPFSSFVQALQEERPTSRWFWTVQDYADVCRRWSSLLPAKNVHVVTVPPASAGPSVLWSRFATLVGLKADEFSIETSRSNLSLRAQQAELLRLANSRLGDRLPIPGPYAATVKEVFAQRVLAERPGDPVLLSPESRQFALQRSRRLVDELTQLDVDVVGDTAELVPEDASGGGPTFVDPATTPTEVLLDESLEALVGLLQRFSDQSRRGAEARTRANQLAESLRRTEAELQQRTNQLAEVNDRHEQLLHDMRHRPVRRVAIELSERWAWLMKLRIGYWRAANGVRNVWRRARH